MQTPLRVLRIKQNLTLSKVAEAVQIDVGNLSRIERGVQKTSLEVAERLVAFFNGELTEMQILYPKKFSNYK
ncbi:helix-turn-helix domain-containing protein [Proteus mirabilis]|uniref:helix-turn-helix domain-containing protein n=1 Tax=Morganellaceae TaxID=1903414 RepID=UPI0020236F27|nr:MULTISPECIES: helix-turn-helix transcriptional regulator [Morganellaceae]MCL8327069.1 helix-turn-helix transcriptional regulator [Providencia thailandensis]